MTAYDEFYICPRAHECDVRGCNHSKAHDPDELDCLDEPCPKKEAYDFDDGQYREIYCIPEAKPVIIVLEDNLFEL